MPKFRITGPDGSTYEVTAPEGATQDQVLAYAQQTMHKPEPAKVPDPTEGGSTVLAGIGSGMASGIRALGGGSVLEKFGLPGTKEEADRLNRALEATTGGKVGAAIGMGALAAPVAMLPGANTYAGATLLGGLTGAALTEGDLGDRAKGAAWGAAGGAGGKLVGDGLSGAARMLMDRKTTALAGQAAANAQRDAAAVAARDAGYVLPPADVKGGALNELLNGVSGKIKTAQVASARNQGVTDELARKALGMNAGDPLTADVLQAVRNQAATQGYAPVKNSGVVLADQQYFKALDDIAATQAGAAKAFPGLADNGVTELTAKLQQPAFDAGAAVEATKVLRAAADKAYRQGDKTLGKANKEAATAIEDMLDRHLTALGQPDALQAFRDARQLIAKTYSIQGALNDQTGQVAAQQLAKQLGKGKPLSGELETIAQVAQAFPRATQALKEAPKSISPLDYAVAGMSGTATGNPAMLGMMAARPAVRSLILSEPYQARMLTNSYTPGFIDSAMMQTLQSDPFRRALIGGGAGASLPGYQ